MQDSRARARVEDHNRDIQLPFSRSCTSFCVLAARSAASSWPSRKATRACNYFWATAAIIFRSCSMNAGSMRDPLCPPRAPPSDDRQRPSATIGNGHRQRSATAIGNDRQRPSATIGSEDRQRPSATIGNGHRQQALILRASAVARLHCNSWP